MKCEVRHNWNMGMGHLWVNGWGIYRLNGWDSHGKLLWKNAQKKAGLQGSTLSDHRMTTGFRSFELPTCGLLQYFLACHSYISFHF